jgi:ABC-2 type transport system ATP-binding protein
MAPDALIEARHLYRYYGEHCAVHDLHLTLHQGEVLGLLGPNGAGKSSTLQMLSGNLAPSRGGIAIHGIDLLEEPKAAKRRMGYLPEQPPLYPDLTPDEYLGYCARLHRIPASEVEAAVRLAKQRCALDEVGGRLIGNLSKGYRQRVGIAQAIVHTPAVVILDEPTVGLDPIQIIEIRDLIRELAQEHSVILSTHLLPEVQAVCDRVQILVAGRVVYDRRLQDLEAAQPELFVVAFSQPPQPSQLTALPGVKGAQPLGEGRWRVTFAGPNGIDALVDAAVKRGWGLRELSPERLTLERVFMDLVYHGQGAGQA